MDSALHRRLTNFLRPLLQDLDGISRDAEIGRVSAIARRPNRRDVAADLLSVGDG